MSGSVNEKELQPGQLVKNRFNSVFRVVRTLSGDVRLLEESTWTVLSGVPDPEHFKPIESE